MEYIQSENGEILQVACENGAKWNLSDAIIRKNSNIDEILQRYLEIRDNAEYVVLQDDLSDMEAEVCAMNEDKADVLLCPNILEYVADIDKSGKITLYDAILLQKTAVSITA